MRDAASIELPGWARVSEARAAHVARVVALLDRWAREMRIDDHEAEAWHDAGVFHDALRDAPEHALRELLNDDETPASLLHGPAAAARMLAGGETRSHVLEAVAHHTVGHPDWGRTGRALYMADYLEPGRRFESDERAALASRVPADFAGTYRSVVERRVAWALREGFRPDPRMVEILKTSR
jgi:2-amino-4-hydroxy-6-hydroxymethyldihydropteridine diphosphokinase